MKNLKFIILIFLICVLIPTNVKASSVEKSKQEIIINQDSMNYKLDGYNMCNINGENYISVKSLARSILSIKSIYIEYDKDRDLILIKSNLDDLDEEKRGEIFKSYLQAKTDGENLKANKKDIKFYLDSENKEVRIAGYNIDGINYVGLRDMAKALDFSLYYDYVKNNIIIDLDKSYEEQTKEEFIEKHRGEYEKIFDFVMPDIKDPRMFSQFIKDGYENSVDMDYYIKSLTRLRDDFNEQTNNRNKEKLVDYSYYPEIYKYMKLAASNSNEIIYNLDIMAKENRKPPYLDDYISKFLENLTEIEKESNIYFNFYKN